MVLDGGQVRVASGVYTTVDGVQRTVKFAAINLAAIGDWTVVAAVPGFRIRVLGFWWLNTTAQTLIWKSFGTMIGGPLTEATLGKMAVDSVHGLFQTAVGDLLSLGLSAATQVSGGISYVEVP